MVSFFFLSNEKQIPELDVTNVNLYPLTISEGTLSLHLSCLVDLSFFFPQDVYQ